MIKNGSYLLKKLNKIKFSILLVLISFLFGCKSVPQKTYVEPLNLLDNESTFYVAIPKSVDPELVKKIITTNVQDISEKDADLIASRIEKIYCGINKSKKGIELQGSIKANIPTSYVPKVFNKRNGWNEGVVSGSTEEFKYYSNDSINIAFPSSNIVCLGRGLPYMINTYDVLAHEPVKEITEPNANVNKSELPDELYDYLLNATDEIRFYANKPQSFLSVLTGANLDLKLVQVSGSFVVDQKHTSQYILELNFDFKNEKYLRAGKGLLSLAFGLANGQTEVIENTKLVVKDIRNKKEQLYKILTVGA